MQTQTHPAPHAEQLERRDVHPMLDNTRDFTPSRRGAGVQLARGEPSHIHVPRPSRAGRDADSATTPTEQQARAEADLELAGERR